MVAFRYRLLARTDYYFWSLSIYFFWLLLILVVILGLVYLKGLEHSCLVSLLREAFVVRWVFGLAIYFALGAYDFFVEFFAGELSSFSSSLTTLRLRADEGATVMITSGEDSCCNCAWSCWFFDCPLETLDVGNVANRFLFAISSASYCYCCYSCFFVRTLVNGISSCSSCSGS